MIRAERCGGQKEYSKIKRRRRKREKEKEKEKENTHNPQPPNPPPNPRSRRIHNKTQRIHHHQLINNIVQTDPRTERQAGQHKVGNVGERAQQHGGRDRLAAGVGQVEGAEDARFDVGCDGVEGVVGVGRLGGGVVVGGEGERHVCCLGGQGPGASAGNVVELRARDLSGRRFFRVSKNNGRLEARYASNGDKLD